MEEHVHVHGAHDHHVEHEAEHGSRLAQQVAMFTAILATIGAFVSYLGGSTQNEALYFKNDAVLKKAEASDQWSFYQAKSTKAHLIDIALMIAPVEKHESYKKDLARYEQEKKEIKAKAEQLEAESKKSDELSEHALHPHHRLALAMTFIQIAIALASVTALTKKRWLLGVAGASALAGVALSFIAYTV